MAKEFPQADGTSLVPVERAHVVRQVGLGGGLSRIVNEYFVDTPAASTDCSVDGAPIVVMAFKGTGVCSELCRKRRDGEIPGGQSGEHEVPETRDDQPV